MSDDLPMDRQAERSGLRVTLYDLVAAVNDSIAPNNDRLVAHIVADLLRRNGARFSRRAPGADGTGAPAEAGRPWVEQNRPGSPAAVLLLPWVR